MGHNHNILAVVQARRHVWLIFIHIQPTSAMTLHASQDRQRKQTCKHALAVQALHGSQHLRDMVSKQYSYCKALSLLTSACRYVQHSPQALRHVLSG